MLGGGAAAVEQEEPAVRFARQHASCMIDSTGVMPDPAAKPTCTWPPPAAARECRSARRASSPRSRAPGGSASCAQAENSAALDPLDRDPQLAVVSARSRSSRSAGPPRRRAWCAGSGTGRRRRRSAARSSGGIAKATETASGRLAPQRRAHAANGSAGRQPAGRASVALEVVERLAAGAAAPQRLAGGGAELGQTLRVRASRSAGRRPSSTPNSAPRPAPGGGRGDAVFAQLAAAVLGHPVGRPGRRQHGPHPRAAASPARASASSISTRDHVHRRAAGIGGRDRDLDRARRVDRRRRAARRDRRWSAPGSRGRPRPAAACQRARVGGRSPCRRPG